MTSDSSYKRFEERVPALAPWVGLAPIVVRLIRSHDLLAGRILCAPAQWVHSVASYIYTYPGADSHEMATKIYDTHPRALLEECFPNAHPNLFPMLKRCGRKIMSFEQYHQLNSLLKSSMSDTVLQTKSLNGVRIEFFFNALELDPLVAPACNLLRFSQVRAKNFDAMVKQMRKLNLLWDFPAEAKNITSSNYRSPAEYVQDRLEHGRAPFNLNLSNPIRQICTGREMRGLSIEWRNCLRRESYLIDLVLGKRVFVLLEDGDELAVASFERTANSLQMDECALPMNKSAPNSIRKKIVRLLREQGVPAETTTFYRALSDLHRHCEPTDIDGEFAAELETIRMDFYDEHVSFE